MTTKSWKNHPQKLLRIPQIHFFFITALTAQTAQTEEFLFQNVVYWLTVYRTGLTMYKVQKFNFNFLLMNLDLFLRHDDKETLLHGSSLEVFGLNAVSKKLY